MKTVLATVVVLLLFVAGWGGYYLGNKQGQEKGYAIGYEDSQDENAVALTSAKETYLEYYGELETQYNTLVNDYNDLRNQAISYVNASRFQPRTSLNCTSQTFTGSTVYTSCY